MRDPSMGRALRTLRVLRASLRLSKIAPGDFVEPSGSVHTTLSDRNENGPTRGPFSFLAERVGFEPTVR